MQRVFTYITEHECIEKLDSPFPVFPRIAHVMATFHMAAFLSVELCSTYSLHSVEAVTQRSNWPEATRFRSRGKMPSGVYVQNDINCHQGRLWIDEVVSEGFSHWTTFKEQLQKTVSRGQTMTKCPLG